MWGIWDVKKDDWVREINGSAMLFFDTRRKAKIRACKIYGFRHYMDAQVLRWCVVARYGSG